MVHHFITATEVAVSELFSEPLIKYRVGTKQAQRTFLDALHDAIRENVIFYPSVQHLEFKGQKMVVSVFEAISSDPNRLLPNDTKQKFKESENKQRIICDYVAGMTDSYLLKTYDRLFSPRMGSVFDKL